MNNPTPPNFEAELAALQAKIAAQSAPPPAQSPMVPNTAAIRASRIGLEMLVAILLGVGLGWALDSVLKTTPLFILLFSLGGLGAGVLNAWRAVRGTYGQVVSKVGINPNIKAE